MIRFSRSFLPSLSLLFCLGLSLSAELPSAKSQTIEVQVRSGSSRVGPLLGVFREGLRIIAGKEGVQDLPWDDIQRLASNGVAKLSFGEAEVLLGTILGREGANLIVFNETLGRVKVPFAKLAKRPEAEKPEAPKTPLEPKDWTGKIALGITATGGNSDTFAGSLEAYIERHFSFDRLEGTLRAIYGISDGEVDANSQLVRGKWEHYYSDRLYSFVGLEIGRNKIQELEGRVFLNVGAGYTVWKDSKDEFLKLEAGLGFRHESFSSDTASRNDVTGRFAAIYDTIFFEDIDFHQLGEVVVPLTDPSSWIARSETTFSMPVATNWAFHNSIIVTYQGNPAEDAESLDWLFTSGLEYSF